MARALTRSWLRMAATVAVLCTLGDFGGSLLLAQSRRAHNQLTTGIECYRRGDYELADTLFQQAVVGQDDLSPAERQELQDRIQQNNAALTGRRDGAEQVRKAEAAVKAGRVQEAMELLKAVSGNSFLTAADKQKSQQLSEQLQPRAGAPAVPSTARTSPLVQARAKLEQARKLLAKGEYPAAEQLVTEADALGASFTPGEDTPSKVRADIAKARSTDPHLASTTKPGTKVETKDYKEILTAGRTALEKGDLDKAEHLAHDAEAADTSWTPHMFGDSPAKLLKDVQAAKAKLAVAKPTTPAGTATTPKSSQTTASTTAPKTSQTTASTTTPKSGQSVNSPTATAGATNPAKSTDKPASTTAPAATASATRPGQPAATAPATTAAKAEPKEYEELMTAGRTALAKGELDKAEKYAHDAQKADSSWSMHIIGDSPDKLLRDVQLAKVAAAPKTKPTTPKDNTAVAQTGATTPTGTKPTQTAATNPTGTKPAPATPSTATAATPPAPAKPPVSAIAVNLPAAPVSDTEGARTLIQQGRKALKEGDLAKAKDLAAQAERKHPDLPYYEDTPSKLLADVSAAEAKRGNGTIVVQGTTPKPETTEPKTTEAVDQRALLRQARGLYGEGKLDEAKNVALKANTGPVKWGLFEDSPDKLIVDIQKARVKRDQEESVKVLAEARKAYEQGKYNEAEELAHKASRLHGDYGMLDLGDRPQKVLADVQTARLKDHKPVLPPPPVAVASNEPKKNVPGSPPPPVWPEAGTGPAAPAPVAQVTPPTPSVPAPVAQATPPAPSVPPAVPQFAPPTPIAQVPPPAPVVDPNKEKVVAMMVEVRNLQKDNRLVEARQKALEAQKLGVTTYGTADDRPETALMELSALADKRIEVLMTEATDSTAAGQSDPARYQQAQAKLEAAKQLAQGFGLDAQPIDTKMEWVRQTQTKALAAAPAPLVLPAVPSVGIAPALPEVSPNRQRGLDLLAKARIELRSGQMLTARRLAEEALTPTWEVEKEAQAMLRSIDAEEFNQHVRDAEHAYENGMVAYRHKDFVQAAAIFGNFDNRLLPQDKRKHLSEVMMTPEMQASNLHKQGDTVPTLQPVGTNPAAPGTVVQAGTPGTPAPAAAAGSDNYAKQVQVMQEVEFDRMRKEGLKVQSEATERFQKGDVDQALEMLTDYRNHLSDSGLDQDRIVLLTRPVEARLQQFKTLKAQKTFDKISQSQATQFADRQRHKDEAERQKQEQIGDLVKQYNNFRKEGKYREAQLAAAKARELDPDNPMIDAMYWTAKTLENQTLANDGRRSREDMFDKGLGDAEHNPATVGDGDELKFDKNFLGRTKDRDKWKSILTHGHKTEKEREIENRLNGPVGSMEFKDAPLSSVVNDLSAMTGINIVLDKRALDDDHIASDEPMTLNVQGIALKSALNILLKQARLTYVIQDEVLLVTTERNAKGKLVQRTFPVADLIIPVDNHMFSPVSSLIDQIGGNGESNLQLGGSTRAPKKDLPGGTPVTSSWTDGQPNTVTAQQSTTQVPPTTTPANTRKPGQAQTMENLLIKLITNTIAPQSWSDVGGAGTIEYYPLGMALVINQVPDVQEQVQELLDALRRLQDLEVSVEVRMITLAESFYERIGIDFNVNLDPKVSNSLQSQIVTQQFQPLNIVNKISGSSNIIGLQPSGVPTSDLNIPIRSSSFQYAIPPFGGYPNIPGADGGLSMGLAFLSDIQVYMFMEAAQGDRRTNVMQAPKLTLFNGQTSTIQIQDFQYFVTNVQVVQSGGQVVFVPQNQPIPLGVNLAVQAVVSADRRFVRLNLAPTLTNLASATVPLFPITTFITPVFDGGATGTPIPFTQFIQQPTFTTVTVQTSVSVPDGGTVLLGGLKLLNEGRNEFGPPVLSKIPYVSRLFKNTGYGRDTSSLLLMVTPRIIINAEEEIIQTGVGTPPPPIAVPAGN